MGTIVDPDAAALVDTTTPTADQLNRQLFYPTSTSDSFFEVNGHLTVANKDSATKIRRSHILPGAFSNGDQGGGNTNLDFFGDLLFPNFRAGLVAGMQFEKYTDGTYKQFGVDDVPYRTISGVSRTIWNPHAQATYIRVSWRVCCFLGPGLELNTQEDGDRRYNSNGTINDNPINAVDTVLPAGIMRLYVNGVAHPFVLKRYRGAISTGVPSTDYDVSPAQNMVGTPDFQVWEASAIIDSAVVTAMGLTGNDPLVRGYHRVSIKNFNYIRVVRFKCRYLEWTVHR